MCPGDKQVTCRQAIRWHMKYNEVGIIHMRNVKNAKPLESGPLQDSNSLVRRHHGPGRPQTYHRPRIEMFEELRWQESNMYLRIRKGAETAKPLGFRRWQKLQSMPPASTCPGRHQRVH